MALGKGVRDPQVIEQHRRVLKPPVSETDADGLQQIGLAGSVHVGRNLGQFTDQVIGQGKVSVLGPGRLAKVEHVVGAESLVNQRLTLSLSDDQGDQAGLR